MITAFVLFIVLACIFLLVTYLNQKTPKPESAKDIIAECGGCNNIACGNKLKVKTEAWVEEQKKNKE